MKYGIIFSWRFNTPTGVCPVQLQTQLANYENHITNEFNVVGGILLTPKSTTIHDYSTPIKLANNFIKTIKLKFPMFSSAFITIDKCELVEYKSLGNILDIL